LEDRDDDGAKIHAPMLSERLKELEDMEVDWAGEKPSGAVFRTQREGFQQEIRS